MQTKLLVIVGIYAIVAFSGYMLYNLTHAHRAEVQAQNLTKFQFLFYIHIFFAVSLAFLLRLQQFYHQILCAFFIFLIMFGAIFVCESIAHGQANGEEELIEEFKKKFKLENTYIDIYYLVYMYSIMGVTLTGMFIFVSEGMTCWQTAPVGRYDGILIPLEYNDSMRDLDCSICLNQFIKGEKYSAIKKCGHIFHEACLKQWLKYNKICPLDRANIMH